MEIHAHVPKPGSGVKHWLLEGVFIALSVGLGFWVSGLREAHQQRELAARVLRALEDEIRHNQSLVEPAVPFVRKWITNLKAAGNSKTLQVDYSGCPTSETVCGLFFATRPPRGEAISNFPLLRRAAWDTASATGALHLIDIQLVADLSELYQMQEIYKSNLDKVGTDSTDWYNPAMREAGARRLFLFLAEVEYDENEALLPLYKKILPEVQKAAGEK